MLKPLSLLFAAFLCALSSFAQHATIKGSVIDTVEKKKLQYSVIMLIRSTDSILVKSVRSNVKGEFELPNLKKGLYSLHITYPRMADYVRDIKVTDSSKFDLGPIHMESRANLLNEVIIQAQKQAIRMKSDTIVYQADSFKVKPNANVQDLLRRLPGIEVDKNGAIKAGGKDVNTVLVEGEEFFGDDPLLATKYLKAASVAEVEVYDRKSKQTELTGIEDGQKDKVINIKLKENAKNGYLSTLDANGDLDHYKNIGGMAAIYKGKMKAAIFGNTNNLNQESKINGAMSRLKGDDYDMIEVGDDGSVTMTSYSSDDDYFSPSSGLPNLTSIGAHYSNKWNNNKQALKLNYKMSDNSTKDINTYKGQSLLPNGTSFFNSGYSSNNSKNASQSLQGNIDIKLDSVAKLKVSFSGKKSSNQHDALNTSQSSNDLGLFVSKNNESANGETDSETFNGNINYSRTFKKKGRTLSIDLQPENDHNTSIEKSQNITTYYDANGVLKNTENLNLLKDNLSKKSSFGSRISYAQPLSKKWLIQAAYSFKTIGSTSNKMVYDQLQNKKRIDSLSNNFEFNNFSNIGRTVLQYKSKNFSISGGLEAIQTHFELNDIDRNTTFNRSYLNWAPNSNLNYKVGKNANLSLNYNGNTDQPDLEQLQPIREINNPLFQVIGNANLKPSFNNNVSLSYNSYMMKSGRSIYASMNYGFTNNAIVSTSNIDEFNKTISSYTNLNGNKHFSTYGSYHKSFRKLNLSTSLSLNYSSSTNISILNNKLNKNANRRFNIRPNINYYSEVFQLAYSPSFSFSNSKSSLGSINNGKSYSHNHEINGTLQLPYKMEFNTSVSLSYQPANASFANPINIAIWNAYLAAKALNSDALELKLSVSDILNQKTGYDRSVGGSSISESTFSYIPRYVLMGITYNLNGNFAKAANK